MKRSDSVETGVVLKSNNCGGQERAPEGSRAPRGHVREGMLSSTVANDVKEHLFTPFL